MKIGFFLNWKVGTLEESHKTSVLGEEILANGLCNALKDIDNVEYAKVFAPNYMPTEMLDIMIYLNYTAIPDITLAHKSICYIQNAFGESGDISQLYKYVKQQPFDAFFVFSKRIFKYFKNKGENVYFLPFAIDTNTYHPVEYDKNFDFDVAYVGNDIKGEKRTKKYLCPATKFNFALFGHWFYTEQGNDILRKFKTTKQKLDFYDLLILIRYLFGAKKHNQYQKQLSKLSRGKISQENMIKLLSSSKILLNFTHQVAVDYDVINYRILESLACKGFVISDKTKVAESLLKDCVVFTDGNKDLEKKIKYYLKHPEERKQIAQKGYEYVMKHCTAKTRAEEIYRFSEKLLNE